MFKNKVYVVVQYVETDERGKTWEHSCVDELGGYNDLISEVEQLKKRGADFVLVCNTEKEAAEVANDWNETAMDDGRYGWAIMANANYHAEERKAI